MNMQNRDDRISCLKGIAIISVVMGHVWATSRPVVYVYHLAVFFFVSGWLYNEKKYHNSLKTLFATRMHSVMPVYMKYAAFQIIILHNIFTKLGIYSNAIDVPEMFSALSLSVAFVYGEAISPANWYLPVSILAAVLFAYICERTFQIKAFLARFEIINAMAIKTFLASVCGIFGLWCISYSPLGWHFEIAFLMVPILLLGQMLHQNSEMLSKILSIWFVIPYLFFAYYILSYYQTNIDLSFDQIINPIVIYPLLIGGIYCCLVFEKYLKIYCCYIHRVISKVGDFSLDIMMMHIVPVKLVDYFYLTYIDPTAGSLQAIPYGCDNLWLMYILTGVILPIIFRLIVDSFYIKVKRLVNAL